MFLFYFSSCFILSWVTKRIFLNSYNAFFCDHCILPSPISLFLEQKSLEKDFGNALVKHLSKNFVNNARRQKNEVSKWISQHGKISREEHFEQKSSLLEISSRKKEGCIPLSAAKHNEVILKRFKILQMCGKTP